MATSSKTKDKLAQMMAGMDDFEGVMTESTRVRVACFLLHATRRSHPVTLPLPPQKRRELDAHKLEQLKREIGSVEKEFTGEVQKRHEMSKSLQAVRATHAPSPCSEKSA